MSDTYSIIIKPKKLFSFSDLKEVWDYKNLNRKSNHLLCFILLTFFPNLESFFRSIFNNKKI